MLIVFSATALTLVIATLTRNDRLFLAAAIGAAAAAVIWGRKLPQK